MLVFHLGMVRRPEMYSVSKRRYEYRFGRFGCLHYRAASGRSVDDPAVWYSRFAGHDSEGCDEILHRDFHGAFRPCHDPPVCQGKFDGVFCELQ